MMKKTGVIGTGQMGTPMVLNLLRSGYEVWVYDVSEAAVRELESAGAKRADHPRAVAEQADVLVLSLPNSAVLQQVVVGTEGILEADVRGKTILDTTTVTAKVAVELAEQVAARGGSMLDAPVTGGVAGAAQGNLNIMVGGDEAAFHEQLDVLQTLGSNVVYIGPSGHGQVSKMVNQSLMAATYTAVSEAYAFAAQMNVDVGRVYQAIENGGAKSLVHSMMKSYIVSGDYAAGGAIQQHGKDIDYVMEEANRHHSYMPVTSAVHEVWKMARKEGAHTATLAPNSLFALWETMLGMKLNHAVKGNRKGTGGE
ncbi:NAD(P)-dependent oxidoreductase [Paenibacillus sp. IB182496]|uniref:NAD(P)-dependent oxidoreductase n=1 Tax=Paenibacillus sabuli TaxID=2772509 RepID=A0A927BWF1_9BACL|nr:NAD(P)-dependent oxidoreductase [Paenibacillus sabuli]MBD2848097.1 NAD(P)-dependent oxidoreductase [Paenibacillus sabuli]